MLCRLVQAKLKQDLLAQLFSKEYINENKNHL